MEETPLETIPAFTPQRRQVNKRPVYLVVVIVVLILLFLGFRAASSSKSSTSVPTPTLTPTIAVVPTETETPTPTTTSSVTPTATPIPTLNPVDPTTGLDRSQLSVTVQNGSGTAGVAAKGETILKHLGYNVVGTGNADNFNYTNVVIQVKQASNNYLSLLQTDLGLSYTIGTTSANLPDSFSSDALVIIGQ
ncbi:MAG TPA: LytR C-terminal domain-containing protein [Patescibacteria group bacterium]|jgi:hypothetical protein|nr:LytR C-terminal domain-containing protein [Patescibacteria group bacterium]